MHTHKSDIYYQQHYSESRKGAVTPMELRAHSDRVKFLPPTTDDVDLMIEAKDKEQAVFQLYKLYHLETVDDDVWVPQKGTETTQTKGRKSIKKEKEKRKQVVKDEEEDESKKKIKTKEEIKVKIEEDPLTTEFVGRVTRSRSNKVKQFIPMCVDFYYNMQQILHLRKVVLC